MADHARPDARVYFPGLNGLRCAAAMLVALRHVEQITVRDQYPNVLSMPIATGKLAVVFFFVLSGFLITYLLLCEKQKSGTIGLMDFYRRRILRIWPIYYLMIALAFFVLPLFPSMELPGWPIPRGAVFWERFTLYAVMLPNVVTPAVVPYVSHFWSIGVEEQFYAFWPALVRFTHRLPLLLFLVILGYWGASFGVEAAVRYFDDSNAALAQLWMLVAWLRFDCMAIGGLGAVMLFQDRKRLLSMIWAVPSQVGIYALTLVAWLSGVKLHDTPYYQLFSILFCLIVLNVSANPRSLLRLEWQPLVYLGKISYGLYVYHLLAIGCTLAWMDHWLAGRLPTAFHSALVYVSTIGLTVLISSLSYYLVERRFLDLKSRYSKIISGDDAKQGRWPTDLRPRVSIRGGVERPRD